MCGNYWDLRQEGDTQGKKLIRKERKDGSRDIVGATEDNEDCSEISQR